jgi:SPP1 gp7 family putative phage head morphogenesis protein
MAKSIQQKIADQIIGMSVDLSRVDAATRSKVRSLLARLQSDIITLTKEIDFTEPTRSDYQKARLIKLLEQAQATIKSGYKEINKVVVEDIKSMSTLTSKTVIDKVNYAIGAPLMTTALNENLLLKLVDDTLISGAKSADWWAMQSNALQFKFKREMSDAMVRGETLGQITQRIRGKYVPATGKFVGGIMQATTRDAESLIRTSMMTVMNEAKLATYAANDDILDGIEWISTLDGRTTQICAGLDGLVWDFNYQPVGHSHAWPGPTAHWACRSTQGPKIKPYGDMPEDKQKIFSESTRVQGKDFGGKRVAGDMNYDQWLKGQSIEVQKDILGESKWALWKDNKLTMRDLIDTSNRPLTVTELQARYASDFMKSNANDELSKRIEGFSKDNKIEIDEFTYGGTDLEIGFFSTDSDYVSNLGNFESHLKIAREKIEGITKNIKLILADELIGNGFQANGVYLGNGKVVLSSVKSMLEEHDSLIKNYEKYKNSSVFSKYLVGGNDTYPSYVLRHEIGHSYQSRFLESFINAAEKDSISSGGDYFNVIGKYGSTKVSEAFAETFALYTSPDYKDGTLPNNIESVMKKIVSQSIGKQSDGTGGSWVPIFSDIKKLAIDKRSFKDQYENQEKFVEDVIEKEV